MRLLKRLLQRLLVVGLGVTTVWLVVFVVFRFADHRLPWILALGVTYGLAAYVILPRAVRMSLKILQRKHVPGFTTTGDGLPGDPVNLVLIGTVNSFDPPSKLPDGLRLTGWGWQVRGAWSWPSSAILPIRPRRSARSICSDEAKTSASRRL